MGFDKKAFRDKFLYPIAVAIAIGMLALVWRFLLSQSSKEWIVSAFTHVGLWLQTPLPLWVTLSAALLVSLSIVVYRKLPSTAAIVEVPEHERKYLEDDFFDIRWRWKYQDGEPINMTPYCPIEQMQLSRGHAMTGSFTLVCEKCNNSYFIQYPDALAAQYAVRRMIDQKIRNGEWREAVAAKAERT